MVNEQVGNEVSHANGDLTIQNLHIKGYRAQGGNCSGGGGGGLGAGAAIYSRGADVTIENSNATSNSNLLDAFRFLRRVSKSTGGGLQQAIADRGGIGKIHCLLSDLVDRHWSPERAAQHSDSRPR